MNETITKIGATQYSSFKTKDTVDILYGFLETFLVPQRFITNDPDHFSTEVHKKFNDEVVKSKNSEQFADLFGVIESFYKKLCEVPELKNMVNVVLESEASLKFAAGLMSGIYGKN